MAVMLIAVVATFIVGACCAWLETVLGRTKWPEDDFLSGDSLNCHNPAAMQPCPFCSRWNRQCAEHCGSCLRTLPSGLAPDEQDVPF